MKCAALNLKSALKQRTDRVPDAPARENGAAAAAPDAEADGAALTSEISRDALAESTPPPEALQDGVAEASDEDASRRRFFDISVRG